MGVVRGGGIGDATSAADVGVAQLVGEALELVCREVVVIPKDVVVRGTTGALCTREGGGVSYSVQGKGWRVSYSVQGKGVSYSVQGKGRRVSYSVQGKGVGGKLQCTREGRGGG